MSERMPGQSNGDNRGHFLVDINTVFRIFGKRYFLILYFGRHLNPRQQDQLINQRKAGNWLVILLFLGLLAGTVYGGWQLVNWRMEQSQAAPGGTSTELQVEHPIAG